MKRSLKNKGFTLMELAISIAIFAIVLVTSVFVLTAAHQLSTQSRERLLALTAVRSTLETIKNTPFGNLGGVAATVNNPINNFLPAALRNGNFTIVINPEVVVPPAIPSIATITVTLRWNGSPNNILQRVDITTMRSRF